MFLFSIDAAAFALMTRATERTGSTFAVFFRTHLGHGFFVLSFMIAVYDDSEKRANEKAPVGAFSFIARSPARRFLPVPVREPR